jgi:hypothetical protein
MGRQKEWNQSEVLSASEIGQYMFCSISWFLHRCGYEAESPFLESGKQVHVSLGNKIDGFDRRLRYSRWYGLFGVLLVVAALLFFLLGVAT